MEFEWDDAKAERNAAAHGVTFGYATRVFLDPYRLEIPDNRRAYGEARSIVMGRVEGRVFVLVCTLRGERTRIISASKANRCEQRTYDLQARP